MLRSTEPGLDLVLCAERKRPEIEFLTLDAEVAGIRTKRPVAALRPAYLEFDPPVDLPAMEPMSALAEGLARAGCLAC